MVGLSAVGALRTRGYFRIFTHPRRSFERGYTIYVRSTPTGAFVPLRNGDCCTERVLLSVEGPQEREKGGCTYMLYISAVLCDRYKKREIARLATPPPADA